MHTFGFRSLLVSMLVVLGMALPAFAQTPVKVGAIYILSGGAATYGQFAKNGLDLAVDEINAAGGILGRQVEVSLEDSEGSAEVAIRAARRLVYEGNVDLLMGLDSSGVAAALAPVVPELERPFIITHAATPDVTGSLCNANVFRVSVNINQHMKAAALLAASELSAKRWTTIGPDYSFGHQSWEFFQDYAKDTVDGIEFMDEVAFPPFGGQDFVPFITRIMDAKPEGVLISLWGGDLINFVRQASDRGFFDQGFEVMMTLGGATEVLSALGDRMPEGVWVGTRYWFLGPDSDVNRHFVEAYHERYGEYPSYNAEGAYSALYTYKAAAEKAGSVDTDAIIAALEGLTLDTPAGVRTIRPEDHQAVLPATWGKTASDPAYSIRVLEPIKMFAGADVTPAPAATGCSM